MSKEKRMKNQLNVITLYNFTFNRCIAGADLRFISFSLEHPGVRRTGVIKFVLYAKKSRPREVPDLTEVTQLTMFLLDGGDLSPFQ